MDGREVVHAFFITSGEKIPETHAHGFQKQATYKTDRCCILGIVSNIRRKLGFFKVKSTSFWQITAKS